MDSNVLRQIFARALRASLASPLVLAGCGSVDLTGYSAPACENVNLAVSGLSPAAQLDHVQLRVMISPPGAGPDTVLSSSGTPCSTASNPETCRAQLEALTATSGFRSFCAEVCTAYYLATTRGDEVSALTSLEALKSFLGTIDTAQEAALLAFAEGYSVSCSQLERGAVKANADGTFNVVATQGFACGANTKVTQFVLEVSPTGQVHEKESDVIERGSKNCAIGRRPVGLRSEGAVACHDALGRHFAISAHLEAASIQAFLRLREELRLHGADIALQDAALLSALEEVMHTDLSARLALQHGAAPERPRVDELPLRPLFEVARDNAVEGCVRETYGALVAHYQAVHASDAQVRKAMARIAEDETRHAELSWAIDRWAREQLSAADREALRQEQRRAAEALREEVAAPVSPELASEAGLPPPQVAVSLVDTLARELWA